MPSKKKKYNARFPPGRIKKIMQTDEEVGKVAQAVPIIISKTLELFIHSLLTKTNEITCAKHSKTLSPVHMKQCILGQVQFEFLKDLVKDIPDVQNSGGEGNQPLPPTLVPSTLTMSSSTSNHFFPRFLPKPTSANAKGNSSCAQASSQNNLLIKDNQPQLATPVNINATVFSEDVSKLKTSILPSFNASKPNFYMELNSNASISNSFQKPDSDEDYDT